jgi:hypothetical protein
MAKSNLEEDIFNVLKQRGIELNTHVENIFRFTGYNNARTLANFNCATGVQEIEKFVCAPLWEKRNAMSRLTARRERRLSESGSPMTHAILFFSLVNARQFYLLLTWRRQLLPSMISGSESLFRWTVVVTNDIG